MFSKLIPYASSNRLILCASPNRLVVGRWRFGTCIACEVFSTDRESQHAFGRYLQRHPRTPIYLIANAAEEDYRIDTVPHATGAVRSAMLARKLGQTYRSIQYRAAYFVGREPDRRKDDRFLFMALNNTGTIAPWVALLEEQQAHLAGIYLLPMTTQVLLDSLNITLPKLLLISRQDTSLRQTYFQNGKLRTSRLTPVHDLKDADSSKLAAIILREAQKTRAYLVSQRLIDHETPLKFIALGVSDEVWRQLNFIEQPGFDSVSIRPGEIAKQCGVQPSVLEEFPEFLHMQALAYRMPKANLATAVQTRTYSLQTWRNFINFASVAVLAVSVGVSYSCWNQARDNNSQRGVMMEQIASQISNYEQAARTFPKTPVPADELRIIVEMAKKLAESARNPQKLMQVVGSALDEIPEIQLNSLRWKLTDDLNAKDDDKDTQTTIQVSAMPAAYASRNEGLHEIGFVAGEIRNFRGDFDGNYRTAVQSVAHLADLLRKNKAVEQVVIVNQPVNTSSLTPLQGNTREGRTQQSSTALFKLKIVLKQESHR